MSTTLIHLAGPSITYETVQRQRCCWCGYVLTDMDLTRVAQPLNDDGTVPGPPAGWGEGAFVEVTSDGGFTGYVLIEPEPSEIEDSVKVPENCCMRLPMEMTGKEN